MAKKRRKKSNSDLPAWLWMIFGLAIGLSVAGAIWVNDRTPGRTPRVAVEEPASMSVAAESGVDDIGDSAAASVAEEEEEPRFTFYSMLPNFEVVIPESEADVVADQAPQAVVDPGVYVLQAGSFTAFEDADRRRATLAMQGIESTIQRVAIDDKTFHRVRIGPIDDLDELNMLRSRLRAANIDVLRIRLGE